MDLSSLASARSLRFGLRSTDTSTFGDLDGDGNPDYFINTPTYFALDNLTYTAIPEPSSIALLALGLLGGLAGGLRARRTAEPGRPVG